MISSISNVENKIDEEISDYLLRTSVQIFEQDALETKPLGCGVLFEFEDNHFLITAAHNLKGYKAGDLYIRSGDFLISLEHGMLHFMSEIGDTIHDKVDLGAVWIRTQDLINSLKESHKFIHLEDLNFNAVQLNSNEPRLTNPDYIMFGFPESQSKQKYGKANQWKVKALYFKCGLNNADLTEVKKSGFTNHLFCNRTNDGIDIFSRQKKMLPYMYGMSGCGLWTMNKFEIDTGKIKIKLCGIFYGVERKLLVFTKIDLAIVLIRETFGLKRLPTLGYKLNWKKHTAHNISYPPAGS